MNRGRSLSSLRWLEKGRWGALHAAGLVLWMAAFLACSGGGKSLEKSPGSALFVESGTTLPAAALEALQGAGVEELFVAAGRLAGSAAAPVIEVGELPTSSRRASATLVIQGTWSGTEDQAEAAGQALAASVSQLSVRAREAGWVPLGLHFDVGAAGGLESWARVLAELRQTMDRTLFLSARLHRSELQLASAADLAKAVDFLVVPLYGQRPGERLDKAAWDLIQVEAGLKRLEELDCDYLVEVDTVGRVTHNAGGSRQETTVGSLSDLVHSPLLELRRGFTLESIDARTFSFVVGQPGRLLGWPLRPGEGLEMIRLGSHNVEEYRRRAGTLELSHRLGDLFYRWAEAQEGFSLSVDNLVGALAAEPAQADLHLSVESLGKRGRKRRYRVMVENRGSVPTDVAVLSSNFVEVKARGGLIGRVDAGEFARWELLRRGRQGKLVRSYRKATVLRLHATYLGPFERMESGVIEVEGADGEFRAEFLLPDGIDLALAPEPVP